MEKLFGLTILCATLQQQKKKVAPFKPFDVGAEDKRKKEQKSDGEIFSHYTKQHLSIVNPYLFSQKYPLFFASNFDGFLVDLNRVETYLKKISQSNEIVLIEILEGITQAINNKLTIIDWLKQKTKEVIWIMNSEQKKFLWNLAEIRILQEFFQVKILLNNYTKNSNADWLKFLWLTLNKEKNCLVLGMLPFLLKDQFQNIDKIYQKIGI